MGVQLLEDLNLQILRGFDLKPKTIHKLNSYYICNTNKGVKALKKSKDSIESILIQNDIKNHLIYNGFSNTDSFCISKQNKPYYSFNNNTYVVTDFINNESIDFQDNALFLQLIKTIGKMHSCFKGASLPQGSVPYGADLNIEYSKSLQKLKSIKKRIYNQNRLSNFDVIFIKNYESHIYDIEEAMFSLKETDYAKYRSKAIQERNMCHNVLKKESLILDKDSIGSNIYITNFSKCTIDYHLIDLSSVIKSYLKYTHEDPISIEKIIDTYSKYNTLHDNEIKILYIFLLYPSKFVKVCSHYYFKQRKWGAISMASRLETILEQRAFLNNYANAIKL